MDKRTDQVNSRECGKSLWSDSYKEARPNNLKTWLYITEKAIGNLQMSFSWGKSIPSFVLASLWLPDDTWFQNLLSHFSFMVHICTYGFGASHAVKWHSGVMSWVGRDSEQAEMGPLRPVHIVVLTWGKLDKQGTQHKEDMCMRVLTFSACT